jgi:hypothetical protein
MKSDINLSKDKDKKETLPKKNEKLIKKMKCEVEDNEQIKKIALHHIDSFDFAMTNVLKKLPKYIRPLEITSTEETKNIFSKMLISYEDFELG